MDEMPEKKRRIWPYLASLLLILIVAFLLTPTILSQPFARGVITRPLTKNLDARVQIDTVSLSWFSSQRIEGIELFSKEMTFKAQSVEIDHSLLWILLNHTGNKLVINDPVFSVDVTSTKQKTKFDSIIHFDSVYVNNGTLHLTIPNDEPITLENLKFEYLKNTSFSAEGDTSYGGEKGTFLVNGSSTDDHINLKGSIVNLPTMAPDAILSFFKPHVKGLVTKGIGNVLNAKFHIHLSDTEMDAHANVQSPLFNGSLKTMRQGHLVQVDPMSEFQWEMSPDFVYTLVRETPLSDAMRLSSVCPMTINFKDFQCPITKTQLIWKQVSGEIALGGGPCSLMVLGQKEPFTIDDFTLTWSTKEFSESFFTRFYGDFTAPDGAKTSLETHLTITHPFEAVEVGFKQHDFFSRFHLKTVNFPIYIFDNFFDKKYHFSYYFGNTVDLHIHPIIVRDQVRVTLETPYLKMDPLDFTVQDLAYLQKPGNFTYNPTHPIKMGDHTHFDSIEGRFDLLAVPVSPWAGSLGSVDIQSTLSVHGLEFNEEKHFGRVMVESPQITIHANSLHAVHLTASTTLIFPDEKLIARQLFGEKLETTIKMTSDVMSFSNISVPECLINLHSDRLSGEFDVELYDHFQTVKLVRPLDVTLFLAPEVLNRLLVPKGAKFSYSAPDPLRIELKPTTFKFTKPYTRSVDLELKGFLKRLLLVNEQWKTLYEFRDSIIKFYSKSDTVSLHLDVNSYAYQGHKAIGSFDGKLTTNDFSRFDISQTDFSGKLNLKDFSTQLLDKALARSYFEAMLGPKFDLELLVAHTHPQMDFNVDLASPRIKLKTEMVVGEEVVAKKPIVFDLKLTPDNFSKLKERYAKSEGSKETLADLHLDDDCTLKGKISQLALPLKNKTPAGIDRVLDFDPARMRFVGEVKADRIAIKDKKTENIGELVQPKFLGKKEKDGISVILEGKTKISGAKKVEHGSIKGHVKFFEEKGKSRVNVDANLMEVPSILLDASLPFFYSYRYPLRVILGKAFSGESKLDFTNRSGNLLIALNSPNTKLTVDGIITNGKLVLSKPIDSHLDLTPALGRLILDDFNVTFVSAREPIKLNMNDRGFVFYLDPFSLTNSYIPDIKLKLGKIICAAHGNTKELASIFKLADSDTFTLWFAPLEADLRHGLLYVDRTEILFDNKYEVGVWGTVDFTNEYIDMVLGLTAQSLNEAFHLDLPNDFVLPIPLKGPFKKVKLGVDVATAKLALLFAKKKGLKPSGPWGAVVDVASDLANDQSDIPPPKRPYPWEG